MTNHKTVVYVGFQNKQNGLFVFLRKTDELLNGLEHESIEILQPNWDRQTYTTYIIMLAVGENFDKEFTLIEISLKY